MPQTVLDGEMVVDEVLQEDRWERRFLAYDMPALNGVPLVDKTFAVGGDVLGAVLRHDALGLNERAASCPNRVEVGRRTWLCRLGGHLQVSQPHPFAACRSATR